MKIKLSCLTDANQNGAVCVQINLSPLESREAFRLCIIMNAASFQFPHQIDSLALGGLKDFSFPLEWKFCVSLRPLSTHPRQSDKLTQSTKVIYKYPLIPMIYDSFRHEAQLICVAVSRHGEGMKRRKTENISLRLISARWRKLSFVDSFCSKKQIERKAEGRARLDKKSKKKTRNFFFFRP